MYDGVNAVYSDDSTVLYLIVLTAYCKVKVRVRLSVTARSTIRLLSFQILQYVFLVSYVQLVGQAMLLNLPRNHFRVTLRSRPQTSRIA
jgi:hypothetical protein